jgi:Spy/CpxP family protein refolding chaperone
MKLSPSLRLLGLAAVLVAATAAPFAFAQNANPDMPMHARPDVQAMTQKRLDKLEKQLHLQPNQQSAWAAYRSAATAMAAQRAARAGERPQPGDATPLPQRMQQHAQRLRQHADEMDKMAQQTASLYQVLTPEQQTIFDMAHQRAMHHGMAHRFGHAPGSPMPPAPPGAAS